MKEALRITLLYIIIAALWIFFSDSVLALWNLDTQTLVRISQYKGFLYVLVTGGLLYLLIKKEITQKNEVIQVLKTTIEQKNGVLRELHHRIKNNLQNVISIIGLETGEHGFNTQTEERILNKLYALSAIHDLVYNFASYSQIPLKEMLENFFSYRSISVHNEMIHISDEVHYTLEEMVPLGLAFNELFEELANLSVEYRLSIEAQRRNKIDIIISHPQITAKSIDLRSITLYLTGSKAIASIQQNNDAITVSFHFPE